MKLYLHVTAKCWSIVSCKVINCIELRLYCRSLSKEIMKLVSEIFGNVHAGRIPSCWWALRRSVAVCPYQTTECDPTWLPRNLCWAHHNQPAMRHGPQNPTWAHNVPGFTLSFARVANWACWNQLGFLCYILNWIFELIWDLHSVLGFAGIISECQRSRGQ